MSKVFDLFEDTKSVYRKQHEQTKKLVYKWEKTGLLEGINQDYERHNMAILLENQARQLIDEVSRSGTSANAEEWSGVALPLVRRVFAEIAAKDFVSVQPMNLPSGLVFYLDFKYGTSQPGFTTSTASGTYGWQANSVYGITSTASDAQSGLYGPGRFAYSINDYNMTASGLVAPTSCSWGDIDYNPALSASVAANHLSKVTVNLNGFNHDPEGIRAFMFSTGSWTYYPQFTKPTDSSGSLSTTNVTFVVMNAASTDEIFPFGGNPTIYYHKQPVAYNRGDFEAPGDPAYTDTSSTNQLDIPEINVVLKSDPIVAKTRKLKTVWTPEFAQDLNAYHSIDAEAELTSMLSEYISMEMDLEIIDMLIVNAITVEYWSARVGAVKSGTAGTEADFSSLAYGSTVAIGYTQNQWFQSLGTKMQKVSNAIHQKTLRGGANFAVCSPTVATIIESIPGFAADTDGNQMKYAMGVQKVGALNNRFTIYKNPYMKEDTVLMGFRGTQFLETGAVYAPYIPLMMTPLVYDPTNFTPRKGVMTRYAKKVVRPEFFGKVIVTGMNYL